jgi:hypothetical protein
MREVLPHEKETTVTQGEETQMNYREHYELYKVLMIVISVHEQTGGQIHSVVIKPKPARKKRELGLLPAFREAKRQIQAAHPG